MLEVNINIVIIREISTLNKDTEDIRTIII